MLGELCARTASYKGAQVDKDHYVHMLASQRNGTLYPNFSTRPIRFAGLHEYGAVADTAKLRPGHINRYPPKLWDQKLAAINNLSV